MKFRFLRASIFYVLFSLGINSLLNSTPIQAASYNTVNYQGKIVNKANGINVLSTSTPCIVSGSNNDTCDFRIRYYNSGVGGTLYASEEFVNIEIGDYNGIFNLSLGSGTFTAGSETSFEEIFKNNTDVYFEIQFDPSSGGYTETFIQPDGLRQQFQASPYALNASNLIGGLDKAYENDSDKILGINNSLGLELISSNATANISFDLASTSDIIFQDNNATFLTISDTGGFEYNLDSTDNPGFLITNEGTGSIIINDITSDTTPFIIDSSGNVGIGLTSLVNKFTVVNTTGTSSNSVASLVYSQLSDPATITGSALDITLTPSGNATDSITGININNITNSGSTETAINIGSGFDKDIKFNNTNSNIEISNNSQLNITDGTNNLLQAKDLNTQFGLAVNTGAFIDRNSSLQEEFNKFRSTITADTTGANGTGIGDGGGWGAYEAPNCDIGNVADTTNGITRLLSNTTNADCMIMVDQSLNNPNAIANANSLPIILMKLRPSAAGATVKTFAGIGDATDGLDGVPPNFIGFSNNSGTTWTGLTINAGTATTLTCAGQTISTTQFALLLIEVRANNDIRFFVDSNVSDGVAFFECGTISTNIPVSNLAPQLNLGVTGGGSGNFLDIDFYRLWQDDSIDANQIEENNNIESSNATEQTIVLNPELEDKLELETDTVQESVIIENSPQVEELNSLEESISDLTVDSEFIIEEDTNTFNINTILTQKDSVIHLTQSSQFNKLQFNFQEILLGSNIFIDGLVQVNGSVSIQNDLTVNKNFNLSDNSSGIAIILVGSTEVKINFITPSIKKPLIFANLVSDTIVPYAINNITVNGFSIIIDKPATKDIEFNWFKIN